MSLILTADLDYLDRQTREHRKRHAQVFTPADAATLMAGWVAETNPAEVLDPAYGTGILARAVFRAKPDARFVGYEIDPAVAACGREIAESLGMALDLRMANFLTSPNRVYDAIIANPPYLKRQDFPDAQRLIARVREETGLPLTGLTNAYALFLIAALHRLRPGGRAAFVIPTEWMNANFGAPIRAYLARTGWLSAIVHIGAATSLFGDALTTASILLFEKRGGNAGVRVVSTDGPLPATDHRVLLARADARIVPFADLAAQPKWENFLLSGARPADHPFVPLSALADTKRGIATGANGFFLISKREADALGIAPDRTIPCVGRASSVKGYDFRAEDLASLDAEGVRARLINLTGPLSDAERAYVESGEADGLDDRYLTRNRTPWYALDRVHIAPIWAGVFGRGQIRFVRNSAGCANLTTFHGVFPHDPSPLFADALTACLNSGPVQDLIRHEVRAYGGGLSKVEPRDLLDVRVPDLRTADAATLAALGDSLRGVGTRDIPAEARTRLDRIVAAFLTS